MNQLTILIIDDDPTVRELQKRLLEAHRPDGVGLRFSQAGNIIAAHSLGMPQPDLIIIDPSSVPGDDTLQFRHLTRLDERWPGSDWLISHSLPTRAVEGFLGLCAEVHGMTMTAHCEWARGGHFSIAIRDWYRDNGLTPPGEDPELAPDLTLPS